MHLHENRVTSISDLLYLTSIYVQGIFISSRNVSCVYLTKLHVDLNSAKNEVNIHFFYVIDSRILFYDFFV